MKMLKFIVNLVKKHIVQWDNLFKLYSLEHGNYTLKKLCFTKKLFRELCVILVAIVLVIGYD